MLMVGFDLAPEQNSQPFTIVGVDHIFLARLAIILSEFQLDRNFRELKIRPKGVLSEQYAADIISRHVATSCCSRSFDVNDPDCSLLKAMFSIATPRVFSLDLGFFSGPSRDFYFLEWQRWLCSLIAQLSL